MAASWRLAFLLALFCMSYIRSSGEQQLTVVSGGEQEFMVDSEIHRRFLATRPYYISYGSLAADRVPCPPMSGNSYYNPNCNRGGGGNPYKRGCSTITKCRRDVS